MDSRKGQSQFGFIVQMAKENKESVITASILLYAGVYILVGIGGLSFQAQPALGYVTDTGNSCTQGSLWVENSRLHWCEGSEHYAEDDGSNDYVQLIDGSSPEPSGSIWIEGNNFHWVDSDGDEYRYQGVDTGNSGTQGSVWVENNYVHYVDANGNERTISWEK